MSCNKTISPLLLPHYRPQKKEEEGENRQKKGPMLLLSALIVLVVCMQLSLVSYCKEFVHRRPSLYLFLLKACFCLIPKLCIMYTHILSPVIARCLNIATFLTVLVTEMHEVCELSGRKRVMEYHFFRESLKTSTLDEFEHLLKRKKNLWLQNKQETPLHIIMESGTTKSLEKAQYLFTKLGLTLDARSGSSRETPLHRAVFHRQTLSATFILSHSSQQVLAEKSGGNQPLHHAIRNKDAKMLRLLLGYHCQEQLQHLNDRRQTALDLSAFHASRNCMEILLSHGALPSSSTNKKSYTEYRAILFDRATFLYKSKVLPYVESVLKENTCLIEDVCLIVMDYSHPCKESEDDWWNLHS